MKIFVYSMKSNCQRYLKLSGIYTNHPQLIRFKESSDPIKSLDYYLQIVWDEAQNRKYHFNPDKFQMRTNIKKIPVTKGQIQYEWLHLLNKLKVRDKILYAQFKDIEVPDIHSLFILTNGDIELWEKV